MLRQKDKAIIKTLHVIFCKEEEEMSKSALGVLCDAYDVEGTIVIREDGRNVILYSSVLNLDRLKALNSQLGRIACRESGVYSYDGVYDFHREYPLCLGSEAFGALLLEGPKSFPVLSEQVIEWVAFIVRHEILQQKAATSLLFDKETRLKNRDGLMDAVRNDTKVFLGGYLCCIRLRNRLDLLKEKDCRSGDASDKSLCMKITNILMREFGRQVYRIGVDAWVYILLPYDPLKEDVPEDVQSVFISELTNVKSCLDDEVRGAKFSFSYMQIQDDVLYSLFCCEEDASVGTIGEINLVKGLYDKPEVRSETVVQTVMESEIRQVDEFYRTTHGNRERDEDVAVIDVGEDLEDSEPEDIKPQQDAEMGEESNLDTESAPESDNDDSGDDTGNEDEDGNIIF